MDEEEVVEVLNNSNPIFVTIAVGLVSLGVGISIGYILGRKNRKVLHVVPPVNQFDPDMVADIQKIAAKQKAKERELAENNQEEKTFIVEDHNGEEIMVDIDGNMISTVPPAGDETESVTIHIPVENGWDWHKEVASRSDSEPYILHKDEFYADEKEYAQSTLTYYAGDDILVDEEEKPIYNYSTIVGPLIFGHGCEDPNVFHVRNERNHAEYEIVFDPGLYSVEVLGLEIENNQRAKDLKHSGPGHKKFKME